MTPGEFKASLDLATPPQGLSAPLQALWWAGKGDWHKAHDLSLQDKGANGSWVHAYLHRVEGDEANAAFWYRQAGKPHCRERLETEWNGIVEALLT